VSSQDFYFYTNPKVVVKINAVTIYKTCCYGNRQPEPIEGIYHAK
jgi:hypothetical protein